MNKQIRKDKEFYKYKKRLHRLVPYLFRYRDKDGEIVNNPTTDQLLKEHAFHDLKNTSTPCSCWMCSGYYKYNRAKVKAAWRKNQRED